MNCNCEACEVEMNECYNFQRMGYEAGLNWNEGHCFFYAMDKKGEWVAG